MQEEEQTNEHLAIRIQQGDKSAILPLWLSVEKLIRQKAYGQHRFLHEQMPQVAQVVDVDDLYQQGYFAMLGAVEDYDPDGKFVFNTYLFYRMKTAFRLAYTGNRKKCDADLISISADAPVDEDMAPLISLIPDLFAESAFSVGLDAEENVKFEQMVRQVADELLTGRVREVFLRHVFKSITFQQMAKEYGISSSGVSQMYRKAINWVKIHPSIRQWVDSTPTPFDQRYHRQDTETVTLDLMERKQREQAILWRYEKRKQFIARRRAKETSDNLFSLME